MAKLRQLDPNGITWHAMAGYPRLENLATNPSLSGTIPGTIDIWRNLANNPSFEAANGLTEVRRNLIKNPSATVNTDTWIPARVTLSRYTQVAYPYTQGTTRFEATVSEVGYFPRALVRVPVTAGKTYTLSFVKPTSTGHSVPTRGAIQFLDSASANINGATIGNTIELGGEKSITTAVAPTGAVSADIWIGTLDNTATGTTFYFSNVLFEEASTAREFFDGSTPAAGDYSYVWTGLAHGSESTQNGDRIADATLARVAAYRSKSYVKSGTYSAALESLGTGADSYIAPGGDAGGIRLGLQGGKTYTFLATITTPTALTSSASTRERRIVFFYLPTGGTYVETRSDAGPVTGSAELRLTVTIPANISEAFVRLYHGSTVAGEKVYWDNFAVVEGAYTGPYFDGSTAANGDFTYAWVGTPNASQSAQRGTIVSGTSASTSGGAFFKVYRHTTSTGDSVARYFVPKGAGAASWRIASVQGMDYSRIVQGKTYTLYVRYRGSQALSATTIALGLMNGNTANKVLSATIGIPVTTEWSTWTKTFVAESTASNATVLYPSISTINPPDDFVFDIAEWMLVEGHAPPHKYFDGSTPEDVGYIYSWAGPANASTSIALPK